MERRTIVTICGVVTALVLGMIGCGHQKLWSQDDSPETRAAWVVKKITGRLDLDSRQQEQLDRISKEIVARHGDLRDSREQSRRQVLAMVRSDTIDRTELDRLVAEKRALIEEMLPFFLDQAVVFHAMLTPAQREKLADEIENHRNRSHGCWRGWSASK